MNLEILQNQFSPWSRENPITPNKDGIPSSIPNEQQIINNNYPNMFAFPTTIILSYCQKIAPSVIYTPLRFCLDKL